MCVNVSVRLPSTTNGKFGGFLHLAEPQQGECPRSMHRKQHRIDRAEIICGVGLGYRARDRRSGSVRMRWRNEPTRSWDLDGWIDPARQWRRRARAEATALDPSPNVLQGRQDRPP